MIRCVSVSCGGIFCLFLCVLMWDLIYFYDSFSICFFVFWKFPSLSLCIANDSESVKSGSVSVYEVDREKMRVKSLLEGAHGCYVLSFSIVKEGEAGAPVTGDVDVLSVAEVAGVVAMVDGDVAKVAVVTGVAVDSDASGFSLGLCFCCSYS